MARKIVKAINNKTYDLDTLIDVRCSYRGMTVSDAIEKDRHCIMELIKRYGLYFTDAVVEKAGFKRTISNERIYHEVVERKTVAKPRSLKKDTESVDKILDSLNTITSSGLDEDVIKSTDNEDESTYIITAINTNNRDYDEDEDE